MGRLVAAGTHAAAATAASAPSRGSDGDEDRRTPGRTRLHIPSTLSHADVAVCDAILRRVLRLIDMQFLSLVATLFGGGASVDRGGVPVQDALGRRSRVLGQGARSHHLHRGWRVRSKLGPPRPHRADPSHSPQQQRPKKAQQVSGRTTPRHRPTHGLSTCVTGDESDSPGRHRVARLRPAAR